MLYSQQQALTFLGIEQSTFVYWMRAVPRIQRLKGRGCRFEKSDLVALGVIHRLTTAGVGVSALGSIVDTIFDLLKTEGAYEGRAFVIQEGEATLASLPILKVDSNLSIIVPLEPIQHRIQAHERAGDLLPLERLMIHHET